MNYTREKRSHRIKKLESLLSFLTKNLDLERYRIQVYYHTGHKTTHVEIWTIGEYPVETSFKPCQYPKLCFEWVPGWSGRHYTLDREFLKEK